MNRARVVLAIAIVAISVSSLRAHHSFAAEFDANKPITLKGTVVKMDWVNPHSWIHLDVKNPDGTVTRWMIEGGTPNTLVRRGFTKNSLLPGTEITIEGYQAKNGANRANGADLILPDGKRLFMGSSGHRRAQRSRSRQSRARVRPESSPPPATSRNQFSRSSPAST